MMRAKILLWPKWLLVTEMMATFVQMILPWYQVHIVLTTTFIKKIIARINLPDKSSNNYPENIAWLCCFLVACKGGWIWRVVREKIKRIIHPCNLLIALRIRTSPIYHVFYKMKFLTPVSATLWKSHKLYHTCCKVKFIRGL